MYSFHKRVWSFVSILIIVFCTVNISSGQHAKFVQVTDDLASAQLLNDRNKILFFHFDGCAPCKHMIDSVFSDSSFVDSLYKKFDLYSVKGFDSTQMYYRNLFNIKPNPAFVFLDENNKMRHKVIGFHPRKEFEQLIKLAYSDENLAHYDSLYCARESLGLDYMYKYVRVKEKAGEIDSSLIFTYLSRIPDDELTDEKYLRDLIYYGYYRGRYLVKYNSHYYKALINFYENNDHELNEYIRPRIIYSLNDTLYRLMNTNDENHFQFLLQELTRHENGQITYLSDYEDRKYSILGTFYPSRNIAQQRITTNGTQEDLMELVTTYIQRAVHDSSSHALNSIAWDIYTRDLDVPLELGLGAINKSLQIRPNSYNSLDTYAALLFASNKHKEALKIAQQAIEVAKKANGDYSSTEDLIKKYTQNKTE